jgi:hypothetical protein
MWDIVCYVPSEVFFPPIICDVVNNSRPVSDDHPKDIWLTKK